MSRLGISRVLLLDGHRLFRDALKQYIEQVAPDIRVDGTGGWRETRRFLDRGGVYDLILKSLHFLEKEEAGEGLCKTLDVPVAVLLDRDDEELLKRARDMGAAGYFSKNLSGKEIVEGLRMILAGQNGYDFESARAHSSSSSSSPSSFSGVLPKTEIFDSLTPREKEVLSYLAKGVSNKEIARALGIEVVTVKLHVRGLCKKLDVQNRTQAALKAQKHNLI
ncbi:MAG: response regulator transcription factor [Rhodospirillales bacterium]|nr:response regulator transcription factor [Alphaproteobacteria bacterium]USO02986.1 MAG: response regulator transcription factor [Rhodospirillales bacterium]